MGRPEKPEADRPGFIRRTLAFIGDPAVATWRKLAGGVAALYAVWPLDFLPDAIPLIGWLDDLGVAGLAAWYMVRQINKHAERRAKQRPPTLPLSE